VSVLLPAAKALLDYFAIRTASNLSTYNAEFVTLAVRWPYSDCYV